MADVKLTHARQRRDRLHVVVVERVAGVEAHAERPDQLARAAHAREPGRGFGFNGNFFPGWTGVYGLEGVHGPDALVNPFVRELMGASGITRMWDWRLYAEAREAALAAMEGVKIADPARVYDVVFSQCYGSGEAPAIGHWSWLAAGYPEEVPGFQLDDGAKGEEPALFTRMSTLPNSA